MNHQHFTLIIIGGGPIGIACALEAKKAGLDYLILEKGCVVNSLYNYPSNMTFFSTPERLEIGSIPFVSINAKPTRPEALEYYRRVVTDNLIRINLFEEVMDVMPGDEGYRIITSRQEYHATYVIIATGFYGIPFLLNVPGEELPKVRHYYKDAHFYAFQRVVVVGANNSAVDAALETWRKGAEVTMVVRQPAIGERVKYWVRPDIENRIEEGCIRAYFNSSVLAIREKEIDIDTPEGKITIENDWVLAMTGYQPDLGFLQRLGIELSNDDIMKPSFNERTHESNVPDIYLAGVICAGMATNELFIENSRSHARHIIHDIMRKQ